MKAAVPPTLVWESRHPDGEISISVIVPVFNRAEQLRALLHALAAQTYPHERFEVLICDDGSQDDLGPVLADAAKAHGLLLVHLRQERAGPGAARNLGIANARGELLAFTDSDCEPAPHWLDAFSLALRESGVGLAGGRVEHHADGSLMSQCANYLMSTMIGAAGARDPRSLVSMRYYPRAGNLAVHRHLALQAQGFPNRRYGEDIEFSHKVAAVGQRVCFVPDATIRHHEGRELPAILRESFRKGAARIELARSVGAHQGVHALPAAFVAYLVLLPILLFAWPALGAWAAMPFLIYCVGLAAMSLRGTLALRRIPALVCLPCCAFAMHCGYGCGYWAAAVGAIRRQSAGGTLEWASLLAVTRRQGPHAAFAPSVEVSCAEHGR